MSLILWPAALGIGIVLGLFGAGGGLITVPVLIYLAHIPVKEAIGISLWVVAIASFAAVVQQRAWRLLQPGLLITFGTTGILGSIAGSLLAHVIPERVQLGLFALLIFAVSWWMTRVSLTEQISVFRFIPAAITGLAIGLLTGVLGVGGGFLLVPALIYLGINDFPAAVAHSLVLITLNAFTGAIAYLSTFQLPFTMVLVFSLLATLGTAIGSHLLKRLPNAHLHKAFIAILLVTGSVMLWRTVS